jgi:hypothetical protein
MARVVVAPVTWIWRMIGSKLAARLSPAARLDAFISLKFDAKAAAGQRCFRSERHSGSAIRGAPGGQCHAMTVQN